MSILFSVRPESAHCEVNTDGATCTISPSLSWQTLGTYTSRTLSVPYSYLWRLLCLMMNRFSSVGYCLLGFFPSVRIVWGLLILFLFSGFDSILCISPVQDGYTGLLSACPSGGPEETCFGFLGLFFFFFFISLASPLPPPLGKSSASSKITLLGVSLEGGNCLLGFHNLTLPLLPCCWFLLVLCAGPLTSWFSWKKMWLLVRLWGVWWDWWLFL